MTASGWWWSVCVYVCLDLVCVCVYIVWWGGGQRSQPLEVCEVRGGDFGDQIMSVQAASRDPDPLSFLNLGFLHRTGEHDK